MPSPEFKKLMKLLKGDVIKTKDGYYKRLDTNNGSLAVANIDSKGIPLKPKYIGGTKKETRDKFWEQTPIFAHAADSIANRYGIDPDLLRYRLNHEGFVDHMVIINNAPYVDKQLKEVGAPKRILGYDMLHDSGALNPTRGFTDFGLDDVADMINDGRVKLINEQWKDAYNINEKGRKVHSAEGNTILDNMGIMAATLKYYKDKAAKDYPKESDYQQSVRANAMYNAGPSGGNTIINNGSTKYNYKRRTLSGDY